MLKLYKRTIIISIVVTVIFVTISIICESKLFPYRAVVQNYAIGIACSLMVVIITTTLQYLHEHNKVFSDYKAGLRKLIFHLQFSFFEEEPDEKRSDSYYDLVYDNLGEAFKMFRKNEHELIWFSAYKKSQQEEITKHAGLIWIDYIRGDRREHKIALQNLINHPNFLPLMDSAISFLPDGFEKDMIISDRKYVIEYMNGKTDE